MGNRIVRAWADYVLFRYSGSRYGLQLLSGDPFGPDIIAKNDNEAIKKCPSIVRDEWERIHGKARPKAQEILVDLENTEADLLSGLSDEDLGQFKNILSNWQAYTNLEIERRRAEKGQEK